MNQKVHMAYNFNCLFETNRLLKVTGIFMLVEEPLRILGVSSYSGLVYPCLM